jgi:hypothetical protein
MPKFFKFALSVKCPAAVAAPATGAGEQGKCVPPHRERAQEALPNHVLSIETRPPKRKSTRKSRPAGRRANNDSI